jgi:transposase
MDEIKHYSDEFKKMVVKEVLSGHMSKEEAKRRFGIKGSCAVLYWIRKFEPLQYDKMKKNQPISIQTKKNQPLSNQELEQLKAENKRLREEIDLERLKVLSLNVMIDLAEEQLKVPIRKKSGAKQ